MGEILIKIELNHDEFLDTLTKVQRFRILGNFTHAVQEREFSSSVKNNLSSGTCKGAADKVAEAFRANNRRNPHHGDSNQEDDNLRIQFRGYSNRYPPTKQQKNLTPSFYRQLFHRSISRTAFLSILCIPSFFWTCRFYAYSHAPSERKTKLCRVKIIRIFSSTRELSHNNPNLIKSKRVT